MPFNISATCSIGNIVSRRVQPMRAVKQARDYRKMGYTNISILDIDTGEKYDANALATKTQAAMAAAQAAQ